MACSVWAVWAAKPTAEHALIIPLRSASLSRSRETSGRNGKKRSLTTSATVLALATFRDITIKTAEHNRRRPSGVLAYLDDLSKIVTLESIRVPTPEAPSCDHHPSDSGWDGLCGFSVAPTGEVG
jgi:hypothetical protein